MPKTFNAEIKERVKHIIGGDKDWKECLEINSKSLKHYDKHRLIKNYWMNDKEWEIKDNKLVITELNKDKGLIDWLWQFKI